jgi:hypothetical protein
MSQTPLIGCAGREPTLGKARVESLEALGPHKFASPNGLRSQHAQTRCRCMKTSSSRTCSRAVEILPYVYRANARLLANLKQRSPRP